MDHKLHWYFLSATEHTDVFHHPSRGCEGLIPVIKLQENILRDH